jgi:hypothetical protein
MNRLILAVCIIGFAFKGYSQELNATVSVNCINLPNSNKESLVHFAEDIQTYLNSTKFTGSDWKFERINCAFTISVTTASDEVNYSGQVVVTSQRRIYKTNEYSPMLKIMDNSWNFLYEKKQAFYFNPSIFNSVTSFFDYYAFVIIGMESDSWEKLGGTYYFSKASDILNMGQSSNFSSGWSSSSGNYNRKDYIDNILSEKYRFFREGFADYHFAVDMYSQKIPNQFKKDQYVKKAQEKIIEFVKTIEANKVMLDVKSFYPKVFFDAKSGEIIDKLKSYSDKQIFETLKNIDPPHSSKYDEMLQIH